MRYNGGPTKGIAKFAELRGLALQIYNTMGVQERMDLLGCSRSQAQRLADMARFAVDDMCALLEHGGYEITVEKKAF